MSVALITLAVFDLDRMADFYRQALGTSPRRTTSAAEFRIDGLRLILFVPGADAVAYAGAGDGRWQFCVTTLDLATTLAALQAGGARLDGVIRQEPHGRECRLRDPEGNPLILWETGHP